MHKTLIAALAASALVLAACGSDSDGGGGPQSDVATMLIESLDEAGVDYDADCIEDQTSQLSDEDAEAIVAAGTDGDPDVSDEASEIGESITACFELGS